MNNVRPRASSAPDSTSTSSPSIQINNNTIRQYFDRGIVSEAGEGAADLNITVTNNTVTEFADATNSLHGIHFDNGILTTDTNDVCIAVSGNSVATAGNEAQGGADIRIRKSPTAPMTVRFPGLVGSTSTDVDNLVTAANPTSEYQSSGSSRTTVRDDSTYSFGTSRLARRRTAGEGVMKRTPSPHDSRQPAG